MEDVVAGSAVAMEIGTAARSGSIDKASQLIAHAALGCVSAVLDQINARFGMDTIRIRPNSPHYGFFERG